MDGDEGGAMFVFGWSDPDSDSELSDTTAAAATTTAAAAAYGVEWWCMIDEVLMVMAPGPWPECPADHHSRSR
jgi:hypothetical protein